VCSLNTDDDSYPSVSDEVMENVRVKLSLDGKPLIIPVRVRKLSFLIPLWLLKILQLTNITKYKELRTEVEDCVQGLGLQASKEVILTFEAP
jgi:hypothetical protein